MFCSVDHFSLVFWSIWTFFTVLPTRIWLGIYFWWLQELNTRYRFWILSDFRELTFCGPYGPCSYLISSPVCSVFEIFHSLLSSPPPSPIKNQNRCFFSVKPKLENIYITILYNYHEFVGLWLVRWIGQWQVSCVRIMSIFKFPSIIIMVIKSIPPATSHME